MKIDIVYTWVDGSDPAWRKRKSERLKQFGKVAPESDSDARFMDNNELRYSLRSINKYARWFNNIYIVTDNQVPDWLNTNHPQIHIVDHKDIFNDPTELPTYSARVIESRLHHIKNLSEHFIYFNDDMLLGNFSSPNQFFINKNKCRVFVSEMMSFPSKKSFDITLRAAGNRNDHQHAIVNTRKLIRDKFNKSVYFNIRHGAKPLLKSGLSEVENLFHKEIEQTRKNSFRTNNDVLPIHLFEFYSLITGIGKPKYLKTTSSGKKGIGMFLANSKYTFGYINLHDDDVEQKLDNIKANKPFMICLNQTPKTPDNNMEITKKFLREYYFEKSPFEQD